MASLREAQERYARHYLALAERVEPHLRGAEQDTWLDRLELEHENVRAVLRWAQAGGEQETGLQLAGAVWRFWAVRGYLSEGRSWLEGLLAQVEAQETGSVAPAVRAKALDGASNLAYRLGDHARATVLHEESLALCREMDDKQSIAASLLHLGNVAWAQGDYARVTALFEESLALCRELGDAWRIARPLGNLGNVALEQGDYARATVLYEESLTLLRGLGDKRGIAVSLGNLGILA
jgi:non-specific serine/threonine protein kinase